LGGLAGTAATHKTIKVLIRISTSNSTKRSLALIGRAHFGDGERRFHAMVSWYFARS